MKRYKQYFALLLAGMLFLTIAGCSETKDAETIIYNEKGESLASGSKVGFEQVASYMEGDITYIYYRCKTTNVMYVWRQYKNWDIAGEAYGGFTAMLDPETSGPLIYEKWLAYLDASSSENNS